MTLKIVSIGNAGELSRERIIMRAENDLNLTNYAVFCCHKGTKFLQAGDIPNVYWFWDHEIKKGDLVILYTKDGQSSVKNSEGNTSSYFFYWKKDETLWSLDRVAACVNTLSWNTFMALPEE